MKFQIRSTFLLTIVFAVVCGSHAATITVYDDVHGGGKSSRASYNVEVSPTHCSNLPGEWNDRISSINTQGHCVIAFEHGDCTGRGERIAPGTPHHGNLPDLGMNDSITSLKQC